MITALVTGKIRTAATEGAMAATMATSADHHLEEVMAMGVASVMAVALVAMMGIMTIFKTMLMIVVMMVAVVLMPVVMTRGMEKVSLGVGTAAGVLRMGEGVTHVNRLL